LKLTKTQIKYLRRGRVGRLGTFDQSNRAHLVPIVYASVGNNLFFVVDNKKKRGDTLKRIRNISYTGKATLLVDNYSENWVALSYLMIFCKAAIIGPDERMNEKMAAAKSLKKKYIQYQKGGYFPKNIHQAIFVKLEPQKAIYWQNLRHSVA
jgi:PPOX class probable F420-dependent enzyme